LFDSSSARAVLFIALSGDFSSPGLSGSFDAALAHLIDSEHCALAMDVLAAFLTSGDARARSLDNLQGVEHRLMSLDSEKLFSLAVRWFESGDPILCEAVARVITRRERAQPFDATLAPFALTGERQVVLCHKAIAYLFFQPTVAASFLVAALRATDKTTEPKLIDTLFEMLLINYGDTVARYLKTLSSSDVAHRGVRKSLRLYSAYQKGLVTEAAPIKELLPSASQRVSVGQKNYALGKEIRKQAHRESVLSRLVHRSTLLYGRKSLTYAGGVDKPPVSLELRTIRAGLEMPRLEVMDPVGLDFLIRIFKTSQVK
jgi:hypothetical protein